MIPWVETKPNANPVCPLFCPISWLQTLKTTKSGQNRTLPCLGRRLQLCLFLSFIMVALLFLICLCFLPDVFHSSQSLRRHRKVCLTMKVMSQKENVFFWPVGHPVIPSNADSTWHDARLFSMASTSMATDWIIIQKLRYIWLIWVDLLYYGVFLSIQAVCIRPVSHA